jgi:chemotaxis protein methyltransferase CheR
MTEAEIEDIEIELLLTAAQRRYGYDFQRYARASLRRRLRAFAESNGASSLIDLLPRLLRDESFIEKLVSSISVSVTELFRDPAGFSALRNKVFPWLRTHPHIKVWHAGCATGEEVVSLAILLEEAALLPRTQLYATDLSARALASARDGVYDEETLKSAEAGYRAAGGSGQLSRHYVAQYGRGKLGSRLLERIVFSQHNLATDAAFGKMQLICCRNVMIYFDRHLQERVVTLLHDSLSHRGFLLLGPKESLSMLNAGRYFECVDDNVRLYRAL